MSGTENPSLSDDRSPAEVESVVRLNTNLEIVNHNLLRNLPSDKMAVILLLFRIIKKNCHVALLQDIKIKSIFSFSLLNNHLAFCVTCHGREPLTALIPPTMKGLT